ncbi:uncharacterized protein LOC115279777 [Suricata suricatta]|uniref:uncharacterized protein LOC115279777 n=1 Tax=Suricata suricatta TaxID=37032 RepID=UPI0011560BA6|nr:uncharacterized protein LOC115279777 [Suricata suricatta]
MGKEGIFGIQLQDCGGASLFLCLLVPLWQRCPAAETLGSPARVCTGLRKGLPARPRPARGLLGDVVRPPARAPPCASAQAAGSSYSAGRVRRAGSAHERLAAASGPKTSRRLPGEKGFPPRLQHCRFSLQFVSALHICPAVSLRLWRCSATLSSAGAPSDLTSAELCLRGKEAQGLNFGQILQRLKRSPTELLLNWTTGMHNFRDSSWNDDSPVPSPGLCSSSYLKSVFHSLCTSWLLILVSSVPPPRWDFSVGPAGLRPFGRPCFSLTSALTAFSGQLCWNRRCCLLISATLRPGNDN